MTRPSKLRRDLMTGDVSVVRIMKGLPHFLCSLIVGRIGFLDTAVNLFTSYQVCRFDTKSYHISLRIQVYVLEVPQRSPGRRLLDLVHWCTSGK